MKSFKPSYFQPENVILLSMWMMFIGMYRLSALMSIGVAGLSFGMLWGVSKQNFQIRWQRYWVSSILLFIWLAITFFWSDDKIYLWERLRIKLPIFVFGVCGLYIHHLDQTNLRKMIQNMSYLMAASTLPSLFIYFTHLDYHNTQYLAGVTIPIPFLSHIRYALMLVVAFIWLIYMFQKNSNKIDLAIAIYIALFLHILAVRSALLSLYVIFFCMAIYWAIVYKKYLLTLMAFIFIGTALVAAYQVLPSFRNKVNYTKWSIDQYRMHIRSATSDEGRFVSQELGMQIAEENFWLGCGEGDLKKEMEKKYQTLGINQQTSDVKMPHNQFIWTTASGGFIGCMLLMSICFSFIGWAISRKHLTAGLFMITAILSMMVEQTLETHLGVTFFILPLLIFSNLEA